MPTLLSFHNDPAVKRKYLGRVRAHAKADEIVQGTGWEDGKGCAIGCTLEAYDHGRYPIELGISVLLARLEDRIFEGLAPAEAKNWPAQFLSAIPVGKDLSEVWPRFAIWLLRDVSKFAKPDGKKAIDSVVAYFRLPAERRTADELKRVRAAAAYAAAAASAYAASAYAAAYASAYAAYAAAYASAYAASAYAAAYASAYAASAYAASAYAAAYASASAYARTKARQAHFRRQATKLLEIMRGVK